ncbi:hypothetical protein CKAH01_10013 [Colletotrichum kahawae]|uniref:Uncharacterized protein n=1 Tax=Colletotrichum kahawae TaxID=34407 RepID=A0AAD9XYN9_COLKA|nr:hypothetical protein CKAH01_10013 [Colletotrichum kahawae]
MSVGSGGNWPCSVEQIGEIETAVEYTKILANGAIVALNDAGASSAAFARWFGGEFQNIDSTDTHSEDNAQVSTGETIKTNHYDAVISQLRAPESGTVKWVDEGGLDLNRLVYACPTADDGLCASSEAAAVINAGDVGFKHLNAVVGADRRSGDLSYFVSGCIELEPQNKIKNAQNFAFFALDVMANPPSKSGI